MIYFDHAATCGRRPASVGRAMLHALEEVAANPGRSGHPRSIQAARIVDDARRELAALIGASDAANIAFTKNATEALNMVLFGVLGEGDAVLAGRFEHNAVMRPLRHLEKARGIRIEDLPGGREDPVDLERLEARLRGGAGAVRLLVLTLASNVTGAIMPVREVGALCRRYGVFFLVDAAQGAGLLDIDPERDGIDAWAMTGHKSLMGPPGTGALWLRDPASLPAWLHGGTGSRSDSEIQPDFAPDRFEAGTLNLPGIAGLGAGVRHMRETGGAAIREREALLLRRAWAGLQDLPGLVLHGPGDPGRQLAIVSFSVPGRDGGRLARGLADRGVCCRQGLHCAPRAHETLGTLAEGGTIRWSFSTFNSEAEIQEAIRALREVLASD